MKCLALDTTTDVCSIAVTDGPELLGEHNFAHKMDLSRRLMPNIVQLVKDSGLEMKGVEAIGVSLGPGSFTGLRIGVVTAKTLAQALTVPIAGVISLDLLAHQFDYLPDSVICPLIKVRKGEVYYALFRTGRGFIERIADYEAGPISKVIQSVGQEAPRPSLGEGWPKAGVRASGTSHPRPKRSRTSRRESGLPPAGEGASASGEGSPTPPEGVIFCGDALPDNLAALRNGLGERVIPAPPWLSYPKASILGRLAVEKIAAGESADPMALVPFYIRRSAPEMRMESPG